MRCQQVSATRSAARTPSACSVCRTTVAPAHRMEVLVMGAGAVGGFYGAALAGRGHDVTLVARGAHLEALRARGLTIRSGGRSTVIQPVHAVGDPAESSRRAELVLFTVKG